MPRCGRHGIHLQTLLLTLFVCCSGPANGQAEFPATNFQIDTAHTGAINSASLRLPLQPIWWGPVGWSSDQQNSFPIIAAGKLFILSTGILLAWDQDKLDWPYWETSWGNQFTGDNNGFRSFAFDSGTIYFNSVLGPLRALDAQTGAQRWILDWRAVYGGECSNTSLLARSGVVYFAAGYWLTGTRVFAVRGSDGTVLWSQPVPGAERAHMALTNEGIYVSTLDGGFRHVRKFDTISGVQRWHKQFDSSTPGIPAVFNQVVYLRSQTGQGKRLDANSGIELGNDVPATVGPAFHTGRMFHHLNGNTLSARDLSTNTTAWEAASSVPFGMPPLVINGNVFTFHDGGTINAWSGSTGAKIWSDTITWLNPPAIMGIPADYGNSFAPRACAAGDGLLAVVFKNDLVVYASTVYSLTDPPSSVDMGGTISTTWLVPGARPKKDWVGLYRVGADNRQWLDYRHTNGAVLGTATFPVPAVPGEYEFRYLLNNGYTSVESSSPFTVNPIDVTLNVTPSSGTAGATIFQVDFTAPAGRPNTDWIGLYKVGEPNTRYRWWTRINGATSGSFTFWAPSESGQYELRYLLNNGYQSVATSNTFTVTGIDPSQFTLTATPSIVAAGGALSVSWTAPAGRHPKDWIGLYRVGDPNRSYGWWRYTNGAESGTFNLTAPRTPGQYEFRYLLENGYTSVLASNSVTVQ